MAAKKAHQPTGELGAQNHQLVLVGNLFIPVREAQDEPLLVLARPERLARRSGEFVAAARLGIEDLVKIFEKFYHR